MRIGVSAQGAPLPHKGVLQELVEPDLAPEPAFGAVIRRRAAELQPVLPGLKRCAALGVLDRHKQRIGLQPGTLAAAEIEEIRRNLFEKPGVRQPQQREPQIVKLFVIDSMSVPCGRIRRRDLFAGQQLLAAQRVRVDKVRIPRKRGEGLVGRIAVAGRTDG